jgi:hypothetical protein
MKCLCVLMKMAERSRKDVYASNDYYASKSPSACYNTLDQGEVPQSLQNEQGDENT